jgi:hypothetical protein
MKTVKNTKTIMIVFLENRRMQMDHGNKKKMGRKGAMGGMYARKQKMGGGKMYAQGGSVQPVYGSTVADAMPKGTKN